MRNHVIPALLCAAALMLGGCSSRIPQGQSETEARQPVLEESATAPMPEFATTLSSGSPAVTEMLALTSTAATSRGIDLSFPQTFAITRPIETLSTTYSAYFITGTSDPGQPVYYGSNEIERLGAKGLFGVLVPLEMGSNTFTFSQGGKSETVTINRTSSTTAPISDIVQSSMYPAYFGSARVNESLLLQCTAPSGATVTATWGGNTATLTQTAQASSGIPATFRGSITVPDSYNAGEVTNTGNITYTMTYGGNSKTYQSSGEVYIAGSGARPAVRVNQYLGTVYDDKTVLSVFRELYKDGTVDYVTSQDNDYYQLASGGYLPTSQADMLSGKVSIGNTITNVGSAFQTKSETYTFSGSETPAFYTKTGDSSFSITFYNTSGTPIPDYASSRLFSNVSVSSGESSVTYTFTQKAAGTLWGYNVSYDGSNTVLRFAYKPTLSGGSTPLSGVTIVVDPGHGDKDTGALGVPGKTGPDENTVNLAHALEVKAQLEAKGANVVMTRTTLDGFLELNERLEFFERSGADMFISLHHNSLGENTNANTVSGMEMYYHTPSSKNLSNYMMNALASGIGRNNRFVSKSYFRVTILPYAPSMLCELGYLCNPLEYERITDPDQVVKTSTAVVNGIVNALS